MSNLVQRLRALPDTRPEPEPFEVWRDACGLALEAADEIERLRAALAELLAAYRELPAPYARATLQQRYRAPQPDTYTLEQAHQILRSEQERCAKICELIEADAWALWRTRKDAFDHGRSVGARECKDAIRKQEL